MINMTCGSFLAINEFFVDVTWDVTCLAWDVTWDIGCWFIALSRNFEALGTTDQPPYFGETPRTWRISVS